MTAVSRLHGRTATETWRDICGTVGSVTNGVHLATWQSEPIRDALSPAGEGLASDRELWAAHVEQKRRMIERLNRVGHVMRFDPGADTLWIVGDLVNRGPGSLATLRFVRELGDRAIDQTLTALARAQQAHPRGGLRHRIEHCGICPPDLQARVARLGIVPAMQPAFFWEFGDGYIHNYGQHRADVMFPARSLLARGVRVAGSSDAPVTHYAPLFGIEQALTRRTSIPTTRAP